MSDNKESKRPTHALYVVEGEGENAFWTKIGAAWMHKDGKGAGLVFQMIPLTGRVVLREMTEKETTEEKPTRARKGGQK